MICPRRRRIGGALVKRLFCFVLFFSYTLLVPSKRGTVVHTYMVRRHRTAQLLSLLRLLRCFFYRTSGSTLHPLIEIALKNVY